MIKPAGTKRVLVVLLPVLACFGCSKPAPPNTAITDFAKQLANTPHDAQADFAKSEELYKQLQQQNQAPAPGAATPAPPPVAATPPPAAPSGNLLSGQPITSEEEFTALIRKTGLDPHPSDPGMIPYFDAVDAATAVHLGLPDGLKIMYGMPDKNTLFFAAIIRPLRGAEDPGAQAAAAGNAVLAPQLLARLRQAVPDTADGGFSAQYIPAGIFQGAVVRKPRLLYGEKFPATESDPKIVTEAVGQIILLLTETHDIWK